MKTKNMKIFQSKILIKLQKAEKQNYNTVALFGEGRFKKLQTFCYLIEILA